MKEKLGYRMHIFCTIRVHDFLMNLKGLSHISLFSLGSDSFTGVKLSHVSPKIEIKINIKKNLFQPRGKGQMGKRRRWR